MLFSHFKQCITTLRSQTTAELTAQKSALTDQQTSLTTEKTKLATELKKTTVHASRANANITSRISLITNGELLEYRTNLKLQQQQNIQSKATLLTTSRIIEKNKEIARMQASIRENNTKMKLRATRMKYLLKELSLVAGEIQRLTDALAVSNFLTAQSLTIDQVADYDIPRLLDLFNGEV